ncbi:hypothetical protein Pelo_11479 [Pelomyxa schiedti]|nr:hypothetical protein Pelo_11479 [Pelomyxa schiedti]
MSLLSEKEQRKRDKEVAKTVEKVEKADRSTTRSTSSTKLEKSRIRLFRSSPSSDCILLKKKDRDLYKKTIVSRLIEAVQAGSEDLELILETNRKYINAPYTHDMTALHYACKAGQLRSVRLLLKYEASCYLTDDRLWTCLHIASSENHEEIIWELIQQEHIDLNAQNEDGKSHPFSDFFTYIQADNTPLHYLSRHPSLPRFLPIFKKKHAHINAQNANGETPLHLAVMKGNQEVIEQLLIHGADPTKTNSKSESPMVWAARLNNPAITALLQKALDEASKPVDPTQVCKKFLETVSEGNVPLVKEMLRNDPNLSRATDPSGNTALHIAVTTTNIGMTKALLLSSHVSSSKNSSGMTPLMIALSASEKVDCAMSILVSGHPVDVSTKLEDGSTLLHIMARHPFANCEHICFALVQRGIDLHAVDNNGDTPCHIAVRSGNMKILDALLDLGASRNKTNNNHESVYSLMLACKRNEDEEIKEKITSVVAIISVVTEDSPLTMWLRVLSVSKILGKSGIFPDSPLKIKGLFTTVTEASRSGTLFGSLSETEKHRLLLVKEECLTRLTTGLFAQYRDNPSSVPSHTRQRLAKTLLEVGPSMTGSS